MGGITAKEVNSLQSGEKIKVGASRVGITAHVDCLR